MKHINLKSILFICALICSAAMSALEVYLVPNSNWLQKNARFAVYCCKGTAEQTWINMTSVEGQTNTFTVTIDETTWSGIIFCRMNPNKTENNWENDVKWNQTLDLYVPTNNKVVYHVADNTWDKGGGEWKEKDFGSSCTPPTIAWQTAPANGTINGTMTATVTTNQPSPAITWTSSNANAATVSDAGLITYKATGTTTITAKYTGDGTTYCAQEVSVSKKITVETAPVKYTYYYYNTNNWSSVKAYIWNNENGDTKLTGEWPGTEMTAVSGYSGWYSITFSSTKKPTKVIFTNGTQKQTDTDKINTDLSIDSNAAYIYFSSDTQHPQESDHGYWHNSFGTTTSTYTVTFDANGRDNAVNMPAAQKIKKDQSATKPAAPTAEGYTFGGWYTDEACTNEYDFSTTVTKNITLYAKWTETTKKIYVQGRFRVRKSEGGDVFLHTGAGYDDWNNQSESIQFIYDSEKNLYKLPTYCTTWELSKSDNKDGAVFHFKIGDEHWGATDNTNPQPGYTPANGKEIQATQNNFKFTYACTGGKNVVLWLDLENKKFWYEAEEIPPLYALDGDDDFGKWNAPTYLTPSADYKTAKCTVRCTSSTSRGLKRFNLRQVVSGDDLTSIGAIKCAQGTIMRRSICEKIKFLEEGNSAGANPAIVVDTKGEYIFTYSYATNELTVKYPEKVVKPQAYKLYGDFYDTGWIEYTGTWTNDTTTGTWILENIPEGAHMFMLKAADGNLYFNAAAGAGSIQRENTSVHVDNEYSSEYRENITLNADEAGTYTFKLDFDKRLITVTYPNSDKIKVKYRLVYAEQKDGKYEKYHPSTPYIDALAKGATAARRDTVSLHIRDSVPVYDYNSLNQTEKILHYDYNPNTLSVHLQKWTGTNWEKISTVSLSGEQRKGKVGVYNFVVVQAPNAKEENQEVYIDEKIEAYKGNYYIRTNVAPGGWNNYKQNANQITYSDYAAQHKHFEYYWCKWIDPSKPDGYYVRDGMANLKFTIANDYSNCVSDTCRDELDNRKFTINGRLGSSANVRWMWHSKTNAADRAYIAGGDNCLFFEPKSENITCKDKEGNAKTAPFAFEDRQNWTYKIDVTTPPNTKFAITKKPHNDAGDTRYCILGCETEEGETLILGYGIDKYDMRVVYDFKSDHLIYAWIPADPTINNPIELGGTVVCMRKDDGDATQVRFGKEGALNDVHEALGVLSLSKTYFWEGCNKNNKWEREWYWISFPFDVCVSDIFSSFVFGQHYIIQDYDGASRAEKGCWANSPSYWRTLTRSDTLKAGKGYVLNIGHNEVGNTGSNPYLVDDEITELNIYFPSTGVTEITGEIKSVKVPKHPCSITDHDRNIYDSNWNLIGVPTWVNIADMPNGPDPEQQPAYKDVSNIITNDDGKTVGFYYHFNTGTENGNTWTPRNVTEGEDQLVFQNMHSYLVQWAGTINWANKSWDNNPSTQGLQARRAAEAKPEEYTLRLELSRGETALDQTFVRLQEDGDVTADYDMNYDMTKIINPGATNLYSLIGTNLIKAGANVLPLPAENTTVYVPVGVEADEDGMYRFSMPDGTEGMLVSLADHTTGKTYNLTTGYCDVPLTKGTYEKRFVLEIQPKKGVTTGCNESTTDDGTLRKVLIDGNLYIQRGDALYDAAGRAL